MLTIPRSVVVMRTGPGTRNNSLTQRNVPHASHLSPVRTRGRKTIRRRALGNFLKLNTQEETGLNHSFHFLLVVSSACGNEEIRRRNGVSIARLCTISLVIRDLGLSIVNICNI